MAAARSTAAAALQLDHRIISAIATEMCGDAQRWLRYHLLIVNKFLLKVKN